ncbi:alpha/beta fold hydrolase [Virgisporangium aurantiacum]|uniref:Esterase n=1 Tax=Virgisporangium aurantiacum TaxID=175570 RepID=A0A8J4DZ27_9ACTN|nr:alpha/beta hydrolase [Virgisporangium aurantiacum]GIJ55078.1 esterase [Virgisporangium aurantiacum]
MTTFVLVHGAWHGGWAWDRVAGLLAAAGARVVTPDLAVGPDVGLGGHADEVVAAIDSTGDDVAAVHTRDGAAAIGSGGNGGAAVHSGDGVATVHSGGGAATVHRGGHGGTTVHSGGGAAVHRGGDVVLVGHSYAGMVVRQAADRRPDRVGRIVLVDGWAAGDGASLVDVAPPWFGEAVRSAARDGLVPSPGPDAFGITDPVDADLLRGRLRPHPLRAFTEPTRLTGAVDRIPGLGICCRPEQMPFAAIAEDLGYATVAIDGPHDVMLSHPERLAELLL